MTTPFLEQVLGLSAALQQLDPNLELELTPSTRPQNDKGMAVSISLGNARCDYEFATMGRCVVFRDLEATTNIAFNPDEDPADMLKEAACFVLLNRIMTLMTPLGVVGERGFIRQISKEAQVMTLHREERSYQFSMTLELNEPNERLKQNERFYTLSVKDRGREATFLRIPLSYVRELDPVRLEPIWTQVERLAEVKYAQDMEHSSERKLLLHYLEGKIDQTRVKMTAPVLEDRVKFEFGSSVGAVMIKHGQVVFEIVRSGALEFDVAKPESIAAFQGLQHVTKVLEGLTVQKLIDFSRPGQLKVTAPVEQMDVEVDLA